MKFKDLTTYEFKKGDIVTYIDPDDPEFRHVVKVLDVSKSEEGTAKYLKTEVVSSTDEDTLPGDSIDLVIDPTLRAFLAQVTPAEKAHELNSVETDLTIDPASKIKYLLVTLFKNSSGRRSIPHNEIHAYLKNVQDGLVSEDLDTAWKKQIRPIIKKNPALFRLKQGGYVEFVARAKLTDSVVGNSRNKRVVDVGILTSGFRQFTIAVLKSGLLGDVEIKYD